MFRSAKLCFLVPVMALGVASCGQSDPVIGSAHSFSVAGRADAVNAFVAGQLNDRVPREMSVSHRGKEVVATFSLDGRGRDDLKEMTRHALDHQLSYTIHGVAS